MASNISVSITADVADLQVKRAIMSAELKAATKDLNDFAKQAATTGTTDALQTSMLGAANAATQVRSEIKVVDGELAVHAAQVASTRERYEALRVAQDLLSGNLVGTANGVERLTERMAAGGAAAGILEAALSPVGLAAAAAAAGFAYLAYTEIQHEQAAASAAEAFALTGRGAQNTAESVQGEVDALSDLPGVSRKAAQDLVDFDAAHAEVNSTISEAANQLIPQYVTAFGKDAPAALDKLKTSLTDLEHGSLEESVSKFEELNRTLLNLSPAETTFIQGMIQSGDTAGAVTRILADLAGQGGGSIQNLNQQVGATQTALKEAQDELASVKTASAGAFDTVGVDTFGQAIVDAEHKVEDLTDRLKQLQAEAAAAFSGTNLGLTGNKADAIRDNDGHKKPKKRGGAKGIGTEWSDELRAQELAAVESGQTSSDALLQIEITFWQGKVSTAKAGSEQYKQALANLESAEIESAKSAASQKLQIAEQNADSTLAVQKVGIADARAAATAGLKAGTLTAQEEHDVQVSLLKEQAQDDIDAIEAKKALHEQDPVYMAAAAAQEKLINAQLVADIDAQDRDLTSNIQTEYDKRVEAARRASEAQAKAWRTANQEVLSAEQSLVGDILAGRLNLGQSIEKIALQAAQKEIVADLQYWTERKLLEAEGIALSNAKEEGGVLVHLLGEQQMTAASLGGQAARTAATATGAAARAGAENTTFFSTIAVKLAGLLGIHVGDEAAKTAATTAGATARAAAETAENATAMAAQKASALSQVSSYAGVAGAAGIASFAGAPWPIDMGAAAFGASMSVLALSYGSLASLDTGTNYVPQDMVAQIHQGERIMPKAQNDQLMSLMSRAGGDGQGGTGPWSNQAQDAGDTHLHFHMGPGSDGPGLQRWFDTHGDKLMKTINGKLRNSAKFSTT